MVKLRINFIKSMGYIAADGDEIVNNDGDSITIGRCGCTSKGVNESSRYTESAHITSFAPRENNGSQPVPDGFPVILIESGCTPGFKPSTAGNAEWQCSWYATWKPDIEKLIEQQIEYDKQQEGKKSKLVSGDINWNNGMSFCKVQMATNIECGQWAKRNVPLIDSRYYIVERCHEQPIEELMINAKGNNMPVYTQEMKEAGKAAPIDSKVRIVNNSGLDLEYGEDILGLEVIVKSGPISIGEDNIIQVVEYDGIGYCFETDMIFPFKSQEEIDIEEAKKNQILDRVSLYMEEYENGECLYDLLELMQGNGHLDEIILPLESN